MVPLPDSNLEQKQKPTAILVTATFANFRKILGFKPQLEFIKENLQLANCLLPYFHIGAEQGAGKHPADEDKARKKLENVLSDRLGLELGIFYEKGTKNESFTQRQL